MSSLVIGRGSSEGLMDEVMVVFEGEDLGVVEEEEEYLEEME